MQPLPLLRNPELESVILEDPLDPAAWLVYGDWLQAQGDPRGELVAVQARLARDPGNPNLMEAERSLFALHGDALLEGLHAHLRPGSDVETGDAFGPLLRLSWEFGFLWTATVKRDGHSLDNFTRGLSALLSHPSARFLHALSISTPPRNDWQRVVKLLTAVTEPSATEIRTAERAIRLLFLGDSAHLASVGDPRPAYAAVGDLSSLWRVLPHLRVLVIRGGVMSLGGLELPSLRELVIETSALGNETLAAIGSRTWPDLEKLELWFGERRCTCTLPDLEPIFDGSLFPRLRHLGLRNCPFVDRICQALATANITKQLHVLDVSLGALTDAGLDALVGAQSAFEHLAVLDLHHHYVAAERMDGADVKTLARFVDVSGARYDVDPTYDDPEPGPPRVWVDA